MPNDMLMAQLAAMGWLDWTVLIVLSLPPLFIIWSKRVHGGRKWLWFVLTSLFSWLAYVPFLVMTREKKGGSGESAPSGGA